MSTCCFTGHRFISLQDSELLARKLDVLLEELIARGCDRFLCGGALGFDTLAALAVLRQKQQGKPVRLAMVLPCRNQDERWNKKQQETYRSILARADEVVYLFPRYVTGCMHTRDDFLVDHADLCVCFYRGYAGGTQYTRSQAEKKGLELIPV